MRQRYLLAYDVADPKRLRRVFTAMKGFGDALQYSVFRCDLSEVEKLKLKGRLLEIIKEDEDRVMIVDLGPAGGRGEIAFEYLGVRDEVPAAHDAIIV